MGRIFSEVSDEQVGHAISDAIARDLDVFAESDCIVVGGGPSGLVAARDLANFDYTTGSCSSRGSTTLAVPRGRPALP